MDINLLLSNLLNGLSLGMLLFLISVGLSTIFGVMGVLNFAHGSLYMIGAYMAFQIVKWIPSFWLGLLFAPVIVAIIGGIIELIFLRPIYGRDVSFQLLLTFGFLLVLDDAVRLIWGAGYHIVDQPSILSGTVNLLGQPYPIYNLFVLILGPIVGFILWLFFYTTRYGKVIRAAAIDREMAACVGINVEKLFTWVFVFGSYLAGIAGVLASPIRALGPSMGEKIIIESFIVVVIGGLGSFPGAFVGAIILGLMDAYGTQFFPNLHMALPFILLAIILLIRPRGLFGREV